MTTISVDAGQMPSAPSRALTAEQQTTFLALAESGMDGVREIVFGGQRQAAVHRLVLDLAGYVSGCLAVAAGGRA